MMFGIDPLYWMMMAPVFILSLFASFSVKAAYNKYSKVSTASGMTGAEAAREILRRNGLSGVAVTETQGFLSDHYDPSKKVVRLSPQNYREHFGGGHRRRRPRNRACPTACEGIWPLMLRNTMVPVASIGSSFSWIIIFAGFIIGAMGLVKAGIVLFSAVVFFQLVTLPVEFNASARAKQILAAQGFLSSGEIAGVSKVLSAAAMTYVAAAASSIMTLLYFLVRAGLIGGRDE